MKTLIIYDSKFGNTKVVAHTIMKALPSSLTKILSVNKTSISSLKSFSLLIVGSPTHGGRPTQNIQNFLNKIPQNFLISINVAVFDTRYLEKDLNFLLKILIKTFDYAAPKIAKILVNKGGRLIVPPEGFIVTKKDGPLKKGEIERVSKWAKNLLIV